MITLKNRVTKIKINEKKLLSDAKKILEFIGYPDFDLGILLTTNKTIHAYNLQYRGKDKPTDILSFSNYPNLKPGQRIKVRNEDEKNLGDLIISLNYVANDAKKYGQTFEQRMQVLLVHGICHLLGYDHEKDKDYKAMQAQENLILKHLKS